MKLEFIKEGAEGGPLILLYGGTREEVLLLRRALRALSLGVGRRVAIHDLTFVDPVANCRLTAASAEQDVGVIASEKTGEFEWTLDEEGWLQAEELLEPFGTQTKGTSFQHLNPSRGIEVIYSTERAW